MEQLQKDWKVFAGFIIVEKAVGKNKKQTLFAQFSNNLLNIKGLSLILSVTLANTYLGWWSSSPEA